MPTITLAAKTDVGLVRQNNEDSFFALGGEKSPPGLDALLVVADGMGGHAAGEVASRMAVEGVVRMMDVDGTSYWKLLEEVNREIHQAGEDSDKAGMGTTCTVAAISGGTLYLAHVGDSRAYLFRDGALHQLTKDHSWFEHAVTQGMSQDEAKTHPNRHVITRALGLEPQVTVENQQMPLSDGDLILVCSDGLHGLVEDEEIASVLTNNGPEGARRNSYLRRLAADCSFALGDWPSALKYAEDAATLSQYELGSGLVRSLCQEGDAHLCLCEPVRAWDLYSDAALRAPSHPLPRYYRGHALLLMARLLDVYQDEQRRSAQQDPVELDQIGAVIETLVNGAMEDLTGAADLLDRWGLIPESYQYRNFHLVPTLMGQGLGYLLARMPGPAASRLQSARRSFPKDDLFFREFLFAKCWEQGLHRRFNVLLQGDEWSQLQERLNGSFGAPRT